MSPKCRRTVAKPSPKYLCDALVGGCDPWHFPRAGNNAGNATVLKVVIAVILAVVSAGISFFGL
jgi:hypothetical protein